MWKEKKKIKAKSTSKQNQINYVKDIWMCGRRFLSHVKADYNLRSCNCGFCQNLFWTMRRKEEITLVPLPYSPRIVDFVSCRKLICQSNIHKESKEEEKVVKAASIEWETLELYQVLWVGKEKCVRKPK